MKAPTYDDVRDAARRISGHVHRTPVLTSGRLDDAVGAEVFLKCENLQRAGAFKARGAFNALSRFTPDQRSAGVVAYSSGNHAQAIALAASDLGIPAAIVMPHDAPESKVAATQGYGAEVIRYDRYTQDREQIGADLATERGLTLIPPFDHPDIIAGQGTAAAELLEDVPDVETVVAPLGGGGLLAGTILAAAALAPDAGVFGVEPAAGDDGARSVRQGRIVHIEVPRTIADGAQTQHLGELTFGIIAGGVTEIRTVTDKALIEAMRLMAATCKLVVEPTGALALAAVLAGSVPGRRIGVILSGGNVDLDRYAALLSR